mgnify:CR=1 FL=1
MPPSSSPDFWDTKPGALRRLGEQSRWWDMTYRDWLSILGAPSTLWDIGCGFGQFVRVALETGWEAFGVEESKYACERTVAPRECIHNAPWDNLIAGLINPRAISALWLMEHLDDASAFLDWASRMLGEGGMLLAVVPNEHTGLQAAANRVAAKKDWWVHPSHKHYWEGDSFYGLLSSHGFIVVDELRTWPMEAFILAGIDYTDNPDIGKAAHKRVEDIEMAETREQRLRRGRQWAENGQGRDLVVFARKR